jgi:DNA polymerase phi
MSTILPLFWDLSCSDGNKRLDTSVKLVTTLQKLQANFKSELDESDEPRGETLGVEGISQEDLEQHNFRLDALNSPDVAYSIRRLLRGLASPRESSRLGFAVALTEVCTTLRSH